MAAEWKEKGNKEFSAGNFEQAIDFFTKAISIDPNDHVFYSNRSACYASLKDYEKALEDAEKCINLKPDWVRGYTRKALAEFYLDDFDSAIKTYEEGLKLDPNNQQLKDGLQQARQKLEENKSQGNPMAGLLSEANIAKLRVHPKTAHFFLQQDFVTMLDLIKTNPNLMSMMFQDPRFSECLGVLLGFDFNSAGKSGSSGEESGKGSHASHSTETKKEDVKKEEPRKEEVKKEEPKIPAKKNNDNAEDFKEQGNLAYKKKDWAKALEMYDKALEINSNEITYINNKAAVYFAMGDYSKCVEVSDEALNKGKEVHSDLSKLARALSRKGMALEKLGDLDAAIAAVKASLMEFMDDKTKFYLRDLEKAKKKRDEELYLSPEKAEEANTQANDFFKQGNFPKALEFYEEAIKRSPKSAKYYSNRATCFSKLMEFPSALRDADKALELDPNFVRAILRKAAIHTAMKEYHKALEAYQKVMKLEPENQEAKEGYYKVMGMVNTTSEQPDEERIRHAMADPEIQNILRDPTINQVLKDMQENPHASQGYLKDPKIMSAISKLAAAGILRLG
jgi:stress-induced-phosphoprotein 1